DIADQVIESVALDHTTVAHVARNQILKPDLLHRQRRESLRNDVRNASTVSTTKEHDVRSTGATSLQLPCFFDGLNARVCLLEELKNRRFAHAVRDSSR